MKLTFLGTGTSFGIPVVGCQCAVCRSTDPRDRHLRSAALVEEGDTRILIDCGPDIRMQLMPLPFKKIDALLLTHEHYDHTGGLDDLRPFCHLADIPIYANQICVDAVHHNFPYCFEAHPYPGVPRFEMHVARSGVPFKVGCLDVLPFEVMHDKLPILGFRIGRLVYITDMKSMDERQMVHLHDVDVLVVNALHWSKQHHSHISIPDAIRFAQRVGARITYFTHLAHHMGVYREAEQRLPEGIHFAYDGLVVEVY